MPLRHGRAIRRELRAYSKSDLLRVANVQAAKAIHARNTVVLSRRAGALLWLFGVLVGIVLERLWR